MRAHINQTTRQILGYYPEEINYPNLPPEDELVEITSEQHQALLAVNAWGMAEDGAPIETDPDYVPPPPPKPPTLEEKLANAGITIDELKQALGL
jgi:hypothetical protein